MSGSDAIVQLVVSQVSCEVQAVICDSFAAAELGRCRADGGTDIQYSMEAAAATHGTSTGLCILIASQSVPLTPYSRTVLRVLMLIGFSSKFLIYRFWFCAVD